MFRLHKTLTFKMGAYFGLLVTLTLIISGMITFISARNSLRQKAFDVLEASRELKKRNILGFLNDRMQDIPMLAGSREVMEILAYTKGGSETGISAPQPPAARTADISVRRSHTRLVSESHRSGFTDIILLGSERAHVLHRTLTGLEEDSEKHQDSETPAALKAIWDDVRKTRNTRVSDFTFYKPFGEPCVFIGSPVMGDNGSLEGVLVGVLTPHPFNDVLDERTGLGETGETYIVGSDSLMRSQSRFFSEDTILARKVESDAVLQALAGEAGVMVCNDYRGRKVLSAYTPLDASTALGIEFDWVLLAEMDAAEAFASIRTLAFSFLVLGVLLAGFAVWIGFMLSRSLLGPIGILGMAVREMGKGDLSVSIEDIDRRDEVGDLVRGFRQTLDALRSQTRQMLEGVQRLAAAIGQISTTAAQLASNSAQTGTAISQISTTVEEVRQTAKLSHQKAENVSKRAEETVQTSRAGHNATEDVQKGLQSIRREMDFLAENVMRLSGQGHSIGEIIEVVRDLADQVNLLSVNAAIEAAKAGDQGKGFAVVAQEMRSLAEKSKESTEQVKKILTEIQNATGGAVMAIERETEAVVSGLELGGKAGEAIRRLAQAVGEAAESSIQIAASSQEQMVGMEQLLEATQNIREASEQNTLGARQLEESVQDLNRLGQSLKELATRFKL